jgi:hypothetical protein
MKNYTETRIKIKNYLEALKNKYSTSEWSKFNHDEFAKEFAKEFGVSLTALQVLKNHGYVLIESGNIILHPTIYSLSEIEFHKKLLYYSSPQAQQERKQAKKKKSKNFFSELYNHPVFKELLERHKPSFTEVNRILRNEIKKETQKKQVAKDNLLFESERHLQKQRIDGNSASFRSETATPKLKPLYKEESIPLSIKNGYACPKCEEELYDTNPAIVIPEQKNGTMVNKTVVHCDCGFVDKRIL